MCFILLLRISGRYASNWHWLLRNGTDNSVVFWSLSCKQQTGLPFILFFFCVLFLNKPDRFCNMVLMSWDRRYFRESEFRFQRDFVLWKHIVVQTQAVTAVATSLPKRSHLQIFLAEISGILTWCWVAGACTTYIMHNWGGTYYLEINPSAPLEDNRLWTDTQSFSIVEVNWFMCINAKQNVNKPRERMWQSTLLKLFPHLYVVNHMCNFSTATLLALWS